jgi:hypothetical protein
MRPALSRTRGRAARRLGLRVACPLAVVALAALPALATTATPGGGLRSLAVSVPPDPVPVAAGARVRTAIRVVNPGTRPVTVVVRGHGATLGDDGKITMASGDPGWQGRQRFPVNPLTVPARGYVDVPVAIRVPKRVAPDLYFVGFLVTPLATGAGNVHVVNQIGSFLTVDVPGPRERELQASLHVPGVTLGGRASGILQVANIGRAAVRFWGENDSSASPGGAPLQHRLDPSLVPVGRSRSFVVTGSAAWPVSMVTLSVHIVYPGRTEAATREIVLTRRVLVIQPWVVLAAFGVTIAVPLLLIYRRRRRITALARQQLMQA